MTDIKKDPEVKESTLSKNRKEKIRERNERILPPEKVERLRRAGVYK